MRQNKSKKIIVILIIIVLILILLCGMAYAYLATDILKTNKNLFFKYATQIFEENGIIDSELSQYYEKQKNTPYTNNGVFDVKIDTSDLDAQEKLKNTNNMTITFSGQTDNLSEKVSQDISINYSDNVNLPLSFKKVEDIVGIQTKYVGKKYISFNLNDLINLMLGTAEMSTIDLSAQLSNIEETLNVEFSEEEINYIKDTYIGIIDENLQDSNFSKVEENGKQGYKLTLTGEEQINILVKLLENLKNDQLTLGKINEYIKNEDDLQKLTQDDIDDVIYELSQNDAQLEDISITVFQQARKITKVLIENEENRVSLEKTKTDNELQYYISIEALDESESKIYINIKYTGLQTMENVIENFQLGLELTDNLMSYLYKYNFNNSITFEQTSDIEEFTEENSLDLISLEEEQRTNFLNAVAERITQVNSQQMQQIGMAENENPLMYAIPSLGIYSGASSVIEDDYISEIEINTFNQKFEMYAGTNLKGVTVKGLFTIIQNNNESAGENKQIEEINFEGDEYEASSQNIAILKSTVETESAYKVEFEKEETGRIYRVVINKK